MKKHTLAVFAVVLITSLVVGVVFASDVLRFGSDTTEVVLSDATQEGAAQVTLPSISTEDSAKLKTITSFASNFDVKSLTYEDYITIEAYLNFILSHDLNSNEITQINSLISNGTPIGTIFDIYEFYLTTNDDFSIISQIASHEDTYWGKNWIENAYNDLTDDAHGVIASNQYREYIEKFDTSEILYANVLSRKGIYTIDEILDKHHDGTSWNDLTNEIYSKLSLAASSGSVQERQQIAGYLNSGVFDYDSAPFDIYKFAFLCAVYEINLENITITAENLSEYKTQVYDQLNETRVNATEKIMVAMKLPVSYMSAEEYSEYYSSNYEQAISNGFDKFDIELLEKKGFSIGEIADASMQTQGNIEAGIQHIKSQRGDVLK